MSNWSKTKINKSSSKVGIYASMIRLIEELSLMGYAYSFIVTGDMAMSCALYAPRLTVARVIKNNGGGTHGQLSIRSYLTFMRGISSLDMVYAPTRSNPNIPTIAELKCVLSDAIKCVNDDYKVEIFRNYNNGKPAGFNIKHSKREDLNFKVNISLCERKYQTECDYSPFSDIVFVRESAVSLAIEKISAMSIDNSTIKAKDLLDLFQLSYIGSSGGFLLTALTKGVGNIEFNLNPIGSFSVFKCHKGTLKSAYEKLEINPIDDSVQKPPFEEVYKRVSRFIEPFMTGDYKECKANWNCTFGEWKKWC